VDFNFHYLDEIGLDVWLLSHPERLANYNVSIIQPNDICRMLFVCSQRYFSNSELLLLEKIASSFHIRLESISHICPNELIKINTNTIDWIWFSGCKSSHVHTKIKVLESPTLMSISNNTHAKRQLWHQIQSYL